MSLLDRIITEVDYGLKTLLNLSPAAQRPNPAHGQDEAQLDQEEQKKAQGLLRVDHTGEICAQALYRGQALFAKNQQTRAHLLSAAGEENDHLVWCQDRLDELRTHRSYLNPLWYAGSFAIGVTAATFGDPISLGFVAETENQVMKHLDEHLDTLPEQDQKSRAILEQMRIDEREHADHAVENGAKPLPKVIQGIMALQSKVMTKTAYLL